MGVVKIYNL